MLQPNQVRKLERGGGEKKNKKQGIVSIAHGSPRPEKSLSAILPNLFIQTMSLEWALLYSMHTKVHRGPSRCRIRSWPRYLSRATSLFTSLREAGPVLLLGLQLELLSNNSSWQVSQQ
jgi:hypothetical protein